MFLWVWCACVNSGAQAVSHHRKRPGNEAMSMEETSSTTVIVLLYLQIILYVYLTSAKGLQNGSGNTVVASYSRVYEEGDVKYINTERYISLHFSQYSYIISV